MKRIRTILLTTAMLLCFALSACQSSSSTDPNASQYEDYVKGLLNVVFQGDLTAYTQMTGVAQSTAQQVYDNGIENMVDEIETYFEITSLNGTERGSITEMVKTLYSKAKYEITSCEYNASADTYVVTLAVYPFTFKDNVDAAVTSYRNDLNQKMINHELEDMSDEAYDAMFADKVLSILLEQAGNISYSEAESYQLVYQKNSDGSVFISEEDLYNLSQKVLDF